MKQTKKIVMYNITRHGKGWLDITNKTIEEIQTIANRYRLAGGNTYIKYFTIK